MCVRMCVSLCFTISLVHFTLSCGCVFTRFESFVAYWIYIYIYLRAGCYYDDQTYYYVLLFIFKGMCISAKWNQQCGTFSNGPTRMNKQCEKKRTVWRSYIYRDSESERESAKVWERLDEIIRIATVHCYGVRGEIDFMTRAFQHVRHFVRVLYIFRFFFNNALPLFVFSHSAHCILYA